MIPSMSIASSSSSATARVNKATSELLNAPDWSLNMDICDFCNSNHWLAKDVVKELKRRLQHKHPKVQLLTLTLLETMVKNCGEYIHYHISERKILDEMVKLVKKKADYHVREKILMLLDSWQEAFGGPSGKYAQYFWACDELRRHGVNFPERSPRSAPVITPPVSQSRVSQVGSGMPANYSQRLDAAMSSEVDRLSNSTLESMQNALEPLDDMLQAVNPNDRMSVKDEVIVELAERCRTNQKKLMQMITTTTDEKLLAQGLEMNDLLQNVLARHDGIASGSPLPSYKNNVILQPSDSPDSDAKATEAKDKTPVENGKSPVSDPPGSKTSTEEDEEDDGFALLARRHTKAQSAPSQNGIGSTEDAASSSGSNNALVLVDAPTPPSTTTNDAKDQDLIDLLSIVLTTSSTSSETLPAPSSASAPSSTPAQNAFEASFNNYVVPWAQPQQMTQSPSMSQLQTQYQPMQSQMPTQSPQGYAQYFPAYPSPPWETTPTYGYNQMPAYNNPYLYPSSQMPMNNYSASMQGSWSPQNVYSQYGNPVVYSTQATTNSSPLQGGARTLQHSNSFHNPPLTNGDFHSVVNGASSSPMQGGNRSLQHVNSFPARVGSSPAMNGSTTVLNNGSSSTSSGQKSYVPSYRLFEDLNVLGSSEGKLKSGPYPSASGTRI